MSVMLEQRVVNRAINQFPTPSNFISELDIAANAERDPRDGQTFFAQVIEQFDNLDPNDPVKIVLQHWFVSCDAQREVDWAADTQPNTSARRDLIYVLLGISTYERETIDRHFPAFAHANILIAVDHEKWYDDTLKQSCGHYGPSLINHLRRAYWTPENIGLIDQATDDILGNLANPAWGLNPADAGKLFAGRGLVVGYVQSGKTTTINLTVAKAIDVGYRLIIILGGVTDLLRRQTQRRIDKEVVGKSTLLLDPEVNEATGYFHAPDWESFIEHPEPRPGVPRRIVERLTSQSFDFAKAQGAARLSNDWVNSSTSAKLVVIKKNKSRLTNLMKEINRLSEAERNKLSVLIIDDESDQASINTVNPAKIRKSDPEEVKRRAINHAIVKLLRRLPRSQYVGVTATPVANCFVDPTDANDFYPRHFIIPLSRPQGYMGILDFHDLSDDLEAVPDEDPQPKKDLHIRDINTAAGADEVQLREAIDTFVVTGALKLWRRNSGAYHGKHHTFFFSDSVSKNAHESAKNRILDLWDSSGYNSHAGLKRLEDIYLSDVLAKSSHKNDQGYFPKSFNELRSYISKTVQLIDQPFDGHRSVLVVNSDPDAASIDFDVTEIWKFVIGGAKLSRGYTIEGLTITYFRRKSSNSAALMQMGRWFGYRAGYRDLVRLWISRNEPARPPFDVYDSYQSICIDEEKLRRKFFEWYSIPQAGGKKITPIQIRPLIQIHNPRLLPVARNQMWNAEVVSLGYGGYVDNDKFGNKRDELIHNESIFKTLFAQYPLKQGDMHANRKMFYSIIPADRMKLFMTMIKRPSKFLNDQDQARLFNTFLNSGDCKVEDWIVILPQVNARVALDLWQIDKNQSVKAISRDWRTDHEGYRLKVIADGRDRIVGRYIARDLATALSPKDTQLVDALSPMIREIREQNNRAVMIFYPVFARGARSGLPPIMGFEVILPPIIHMTIGWQVRKPDDPQLPIVSVTES